MEGMDLLRQEWMYKVGVKRKSIKDFLYDIKEDISDIEDVDIHALYRIRDAAQSCIDLNRDIDLMFNFLQNMI